MVEVKQRRYYPFIDGMRAVAIVAVLIAHISHFFDTASLNGMVFKIITILGPLGHLGVDMFFVISGFLITTVLVPDIGQDIRIKRFYVRRIFKILPQYYLFLLFVIFTSRFFIHAGYGIEAFEIPKIVGHFLFLQNYFSLDYFMSEHVWSLAIEEHFYVVYPLIVLTIQRRFSNQRDRFNVLLAVLCSIIITIILARDIMPTLSIGEVVFNQQTLYRVDALIFGCVLKLLEPYYATGRDRFWRCGSPSCILLAVMIYLYCLGQVDIESGLILTRFKHVLAYLAPALIFLGLYRGGNILKFIFEQPLLIWIGKNSYGIYLWHYPLIFIAGTLMSKVNPILTIWIYVLSSLIAGYLSTVGIERYFLRVRQKVSP